MRKIIYLLLLLIFLIGPVCAQQPSLLVMTENLPPFNYSENGKITGISTDIVRYIFKQSGISMKQGKIHLYPWARAYHDIRYYPDTALYSMARTEDRENLFRWVGPLMDVTLGVIAKKERNIKIDSIDDFRKYRIGTVRDGAPEQLLIKAGVPLEQLDRLALPEQNIRKLQAGRIDMFVFNIQTAQYLMVKLGIDPTDYETVFMLKNPVLYLALNKNTDPDIVNRLQQSLDKMKQPDKDGFSPFNQVIKKYLWGCPK